MAGWPDRRVERAGDRWLGHTERRQHPVNRTILAILVLPLIASCSSPSRTTGSPPSTSSAAPRTPDGRELLAVTLPDLSQVPPSAQKQIRDQYASMNRAAESHAAVTEQSRAYGEMGKLL